MAHSEETKRKIGNALRKPKRYVLCLQCKCDYELKKKGQKFCSRSCSCTYYSLTENMTEERRNKLSENAKTRHEKSDGNIGFTTRKKFEPSFPELKAMEFFDEHGITYQREVKIGKWFADFLINDKLVVEIDGKQHLLPERKESDRKKDEFLQSNGYQVIRISYNKLDAEFYRNLTSVIQW